MADELNPDAVRSPGDLIVFLNRLREDIERDAAEMQRRQAAGDELLAGTRRAIRILHAPGRA